MQTFMPLPSFEASARCLDRQRLGKQRIETKQLVMALLDGGGWANHPAARMWAGHELALCEYGIAICAAWRDRGYVDNQLPWFQTRYRELFEEGYRTDMPDWLGDPAFHAAHRSALLAKNPDWYKRFNWTDPAVINYIWPGREVNET